MKKQIRKSLVTFPVATVDGKTLILKKNMPIRIEVQPSAPFVFVLGLGTGAAWKEYYASTAPEIGAFSVTLDDDVAMGDVHVVAFATLADYGSFKTDFDEGGEGSPGHIGDPPNGTPALS